MSAKVFWIGLAIHLVGWPVIWWLTFQLDSWRTHRARAKGKRTSHIGILVLMVAIVSTLMWIWFRIAYWIHQPQVPIK